MTDYRNANDTMRVRAYEENGKHYLVISKKIKFLAATRSGKAVIAENVRTIRKEFDDERSANSYLKAVKRDDPTLVKV